MGGRQGATEASSIVERSGGQGATGVAQGKGDRVTQVPTLRQLAVAGLGRPVVAENRFHMERVGTPKGGGDGMTTQQVLSEGGDGPR